MAFPNQASLPINCSKSASSKQAIMNASLPRASINTFGVQSCSAYLVVDDFGVKCQGIQHAKHLKAALEQHYDVAVDWEGKLFCGITLDWDYKMGHVDLSVPGYVNRKLTKYQHPKPTRPQHSPYLAVPIEYGVKVQQPTQADTTAPLTAKQIKHVQDIVGTFIWYGRACDPTLSAALSAIGSRQTK